MRKLPGFARNGLADCLCRSTNPPSGRLLADPEETCDVESRVAADILAIGNGMPEAALVRVRAAASHQAGLLGPD